jgi:hypothetical protein
MRAVWLCLLSLAACSAVLGDPSLTPLPGAVAARVIPFPEEEAITGLAARADGTFVVTAQQGYGERSVVAYDRPAGGPKMWAFMKLPGVHAVGVVASPDGAFAATTAGDAVLLVPANGDLPRAIPLSAPPGAPDATPFDDCRAFGRLAWVGDRLFVACTSGPAAVVVDAPSGARVATIRKADPLASEHVRSIAVAPSGAEVALLVHTDQLQVDDAAPPPREVTRVEVRDAVDGGLRRTLQLDRPFDAVAWSPDGARLAVSSSYFGLDLVDAITGVRLASDRPPADRHDAGGSGLVWAEAGLFRVGRRHGIVAHDPTDARPLGWLPHHPADDARPRPPGWPTPLAYQSDEIAISQDGHWIASVETGLGRRAALRVWGVGEAASPGR